MAQNCLYAARTAQDAQEAIAAGADIHANNNYALSWAAYKGRLEVVQFLLDHGAYIHAKNDRVIRWAANCGHLEIVQFLLERGANVRAENDAALRVAADAGQLETVKLLAFSYSRVELLAIQERINNDTLAEVIACHVPRGARTKAALRNTE